MLVYCLVSVFRATTQSYESDIVGGKFVTLLYRQSGQECGHCHYYNNFLHFVLNLKLVKKALRSWKLIIFWIQFEKGNKLHRWNPAKGHKQKPDKVIGIKIGTVFIPTTSSTN